MPVASRSPESVFQSAPGDEAGRNPSVSSFTGLFAMFQSAPGDEAGRNPRSSRWSSRPTPVSIRSRR